MATVGTAILKAREDEKARLRAIIEAAKRLQKNPEPQQTEGVLPDVITSIRQREGVRQKLRDDVEAWKARGNQVEQLPSYEPAPLRPVAAGHGTRSGAWNA